MRRLPVVVGSFALAASLLAPTTVHAQQSLNIYLGGFSPNGLDSRIRENGQSNDVLVNNLDFLAFNIKDFKAGTVGAEYLVGLNEWLDAGLGVGVYKRSVPSVYADFVNDNGSEIEQSLKLRIIPFTATLRLLPLGRSAPVRPYIGAGIGAFNWRYSESGAFVDFRDNSIFTASFVGKGTATGPVILGGVRFPVGAWDIGGEVRYQKAEGDLPAAQEFSATKVDLGGWTYAATFNIRF
jgi:outer membrane protein W